MESDINITIEQSAYEKTRRRVSRFKNQFNISDKKIIEYLAEEIDYYRNKIKMLEKVRYEQNKYITEHMTIDEIIEDIITKEYRVKFQSIEGSIKDIEYKGKGIQNIYAILILTDDMYEVTIEPIAEGTIKEIHRVMSKGEGYHSIC